MDGPRELHDRYRVTRGGKPTFDQILHGTNLLKQHNVEFSTLTVVHRELPCHPLEVYEFLREHGSRFIQLIPLVERDAAVRLKPQSQGGRLTILQPEPTVEPWTVEALQFGRFSCEIFDHWIRRGVGSAVLGLKRAGKGQWTVLLLVALGLGLGETLPIWWVVIQLLLWIIALSFRLFRGLWL